MLAIQDGSHENGLMNEFLPILLTYWLAIYAFLAGIYLVLGKLVSWYNQNRLANNRIQEKECPQELVKRDIRQSLLSLFSISGMLSLGLALRASGLTVEPAELSFINGLIWAIASLVLFDTWFYWAHRAIHHPRLYKIVHRWHHKAITPTVWSNNSDTFLDNMFCQSYWLIAPILLPAPTLILCLHKIYDQVTGMLGHAGHEYAAGKMSSKPSPLIGTTFHDQHHSAFHYNFATHFSIWDRLMGTLHPEYDQLILRYPKNTDDQKSE